MVAIALHTLYLDNRTIHISSNHPAMNMEYVILQYNILHVASIKHVFHQHILPCFKVYSSSDDWWPVNGKGETWPFPSPCAHYTDMHARGVRGVCVWKEKYKNIEMHKKRSRTQLHQIKSIEIISYDWMSAN